MSNLFNISSEYRNLFEQYDEFEADGNGAAWFDTLEAIEGEFTSKAANCAAYVKELNAEIDAIKAEIKALHDRITPKERKIERIKGYLLDAMDAINLSKIDEPLAKISTRNNPESVVIEGDFVRWAMAYDRDDLLTYKRPEVNKEAIKAALKGGQTLPGASLERSRTVVIK